ncbi:palmitoyltransferase ZDHHC14 [Blastocystis sp. ATCC 50177/Nand II]|uniref:Palmitoyltransferase n=1 Tax=Blastocystis sp. subtype 1 (strain ATCC 50177 / NandII) TaxID=478820 RepID=A0A196S8C2_BLAHN|nr:palmitoyltransferase ZDHHC14 [Blastocystis sp. ATCC 50177/Nand II]
MYPTLINETNNEGRTLLHTCAMFDNPEVARLLLPYHPDLAICDVFGLRAIHYAANNPSSMVYTLLCHELQWEENTWEERREQLKQEIRERIPEYDMAGNVYMLAKEGEVVTNDDISAFFLQTSIQEALKSGDSTLIVPVLQFPCLYKGQLISLHFCASCNHFVPPRGFHCRYCDVCVREFDHHCPWVGNCVGYRNHRFFVWFLLTGVFLALFGIVFVSVYFASYTINLLESGVSFTLLSFLRETWGCILYGCFCIGLIAPCTNLALYHLRIASHNQTTHEEIALPPHLTVKTETDYKKYYPFSQGWRENLKYVLFSPIMPSLTALQYV